MFKEQIEKLQALIESHSNDIASAQVIIEEKRTLLKRDKLLLKKVISFDKTLSTHPLLDDEDEEMDDNE